MKIFGNKLLDLVRTITNREYVGKFILKKLKPTGYQIQIGHHYITTDSNDQEFVFNLFKEEIRNVFQYSNYYETNLQYPPFEKKCLQRNLVIEEEPTIIKLSYNNQPVVGTINIIEGTELTFNLEINEPFTINYVFETTFKDNVLKINIPVIDAVDTDTIVEIVTESNKVFKIPIRIQSKYVSFTVADNQQFYTSDNLNFISLRNVEL